MSKYHIANPGELFDKFTRLGEKELTLIRQSIAAPDAVKQERTWTTTEAVELVGRSAPWVRKNSQHIEPDEDGKKRFTLNAINQLREVAGTLYKRPPRSKAAIIAVANFKGGSAKTTTCVHLSQYLAIQGLKVLVVDNDPQASATMNMGLVNPDLDLDEESVPVTAILNGDVERYAELILPTYFPNVDIVPSNLALGDLDLSLPNESMNNVETAGPAGGRLRNALHHLSDRYDVIIIDCPPNMGAISTNTLVAANMLIIPVPPYAYDRASFVMLTSSLSNLFNATGMALDYFRILISKHPKTATAVNVQEARLRQLYGEYVLVNCMYQTTEVEKASALMSSVYDQMKPLNKRETYQRALDTLNAVHDEIFTDLKAIWEES